MSLRLAAQHLAEQGRGDDKMLVHMTPNEVGHLQRLAMAHGGSLSINPQTGLVEAGFLQSLLPTLIGAALTPLTGGLINPMTAGLLVGGFEGLRTGDLGKGLMAGLGAYGGAGLTAGLGALGADKAAEAAYMKTADEAAGHTAAAQMRQQALASTGLEGLKNVGAGAQAAFASPSSLATAMGGLKPALMSAGAAAAPVIAGMEPTTKMPSRAPGDVGYIRQARYVPGAQGQSGRYEYYTPIAADQFGGRLMEGQQPYLVPSTVTPPGAREGGVIRRADDSGFSEYK